MKRHKQVEQLRNNKGVQSNSWRGLKIGNVHLTCCLFYEKWVESLSFSLEIEDDILKGNGGKAQHTYWEVYILEWSLEQ